MDEPGFFGGALRGCRVAVWGLGLMGGSLAMALRERCQEIVGIDNHPSVVAAAQARGIVAAASTQPEDLLDGIDLIVLAVPVQAILSVLESLPGCCPGSAVVLDLGSTKRQVLAAMERLPERFAAVGGHPMCGKETSGLDQADPAIYQNAPFALVAPQRTPPAALRLVEGIARAAGAQPLWIDADTHDRWVAATSHVPFLVASALAGATPREARPMVGPGFRSTTRLAGGGANGSGAMMLDVLRTNRENIRAALAATRRGLEEMDALLETGDFAALAALLEHNAGQYQQLIQRSEPCS